MMQKTYLREKRLYIFNNLGIFHYWVQNYDIFCTVQLGHHLQQFMSVNFAIGAASEIWHTPKHFWTWPVLVATQGFGRCENHMHILGQQFLEKLVTDDSIQCNSWSGCPTQSLYTVWLFRIITTAMDKSMAVLINKGQKWLRARFRLRVSNRVTVCIKFTCVPM